MAEETKAAKQARAPKKPKEPKEQKNKKGDRSHPHFRLWSGGVMLEQHKDPILSQELTQFINPERQRVIPDLRP